MGESIFLCICSQMYLLLLLLVAIQRSMLRLSAFAAPPVYGVFYSCSMAFSLLDVEKSICYVLEVDWPVRHTLA